MGQEVPKQYLQIAGATLLEHSLNALLACDAVSTIVVPLHPRDSRAADLPMLNHERVRLAVGADERCGSVLAGLEALPVEAQPDDWVLVHDAARPCVSPEDIARLIAEVTRSGIGGILAIAVTDTVKQAGGDGFVAHTLDRSSLWRAQTPQMFRLGELRAALIQALHEGKTVTDEASAMEMAGFQVQLVPGAASNLKVTVPEDLALAEWYLQQGGDTRT